MPHIYRKKGGETFCFPSPLRLHTWRLLSTQPQNQSPLLTSQHMSMYRASRPLMEQGTRQAEMPTINAKGAEQTNGAHTNRASGCGSYERCGNIHAENSKKSSSSPPPAPHCQPSELAELGSTLHVRTLGRSSKALHLLRATTPHQRPCVRSHLRTQNRRRTCERKAVTAVYPCRITMVSLQEVFTVLSRSLTYYVLAV